MIDSAVHAGERGQREQRGAAVQPRGARRGQQRRGAERRAASISAISVRRALELQAALGHERDRGERERRRAATAPRARRRAAAASARCARRAAAR